MLNPDIENLFKLIHSKSVAPKSQCNFAVVNFHGSPAYRITGPATPVHHASFSFMSSLQGKRSSEFRRAIQSMAKSDYPSLSSEVANMMGTDLVFKSGSSHEFLFIEVQDYPVVGYAYDLQNLDGNDNHLFFGPSNTQKSHILSLFSKVRFGRDFIFGLWAPWLCSNANLMLIASHIFHSITVVQSSLPGAVIVMCKARTEIICPPFHETSIPSCLPMAFTGGKGPQKSIIASSFVSFQIKALTNYLDVFPFMTKRYLSSFEPNYPSKCFGPGEYNVPLTMDSPRMDNVERAMSVVACCKLWEDFHNDDGYDSYLEVGPGRRPILPFIMYAAGVEGRCVGHDVNSSYDYDVVVTSLGIFDYASRDGYAPPNVKGHCFVMFRNVAKVIGSDIKAKFPDISSWTMVGVSPLKMSVPETRRGVGMVGIGRSFEAWPLRQALKRYEEVNLDWIGYPVWVVQRFLRSSIVSSEEVVWTDISSPSVRFYGI
jgi:hypothetical protein